MSEDLTTNKKPRIGEHPIVKRAKMKVEIDVEKVRELLEKAECVEHFYIKGEEFSILERRLYQKAISLLPKPCSECESYTTGECVSKIPCDMNYSAFKPCETKPKPVCRPEQQLNKPPAGEIEEFVKVIRNMAWLISHGIKPNFEEAVKLSKAADKLEAQAKQIKELEKTNNEFADGIETVNAACVKKTRLLQSQIKQLEGEKKRLEEENAGLLKLTELLDEHPEGYDGPCLCKLCMSYG